MTRKAALNESGELSPMQNFPLVNTSRKYLKKLLSTSEIPPGLVISSPFNWPRKLVHAFVSQNCLLQCSILRGCPAPHSNEITHPTPSELSSLETHEPENLIAWPWPTVDVPLSALNTRTLFSMPKYTLIKIVTNNSPLSTSYIYLPACWCNTCYSLKLERTHSLSDGSLAFGTGTHFNNSDRSLLKSRVKTYLSSAANYPHLLTVLYNHRSCPLIPSSKLLELICDQRFSPVDIMQSHTVALLPILLMCT